MSPRGNLKPNRRGSKIEKVCASCHKVFYVWPSQAKRGRKYCSRACVRNLDYRECEYCGIKFQASKKSKRMVCSKKCPALRVSYSCVVCSSCVSRPRCFGRGKFCSNRCYNLWLEDNEITADPPIGMSRPIKSMSKRKQKIRNGDLINSYDVFEFFDWVCIVCDERIDKALEWPHKMSATLEHVVPLAHGGTHTWDNVAPAHLLCNTQKDDAIDEELIIKHADLLGEMA